MVTMVITINIIMERIIARSYLTITNGSSFDNNKYIHMYLYP